MSPLQLGLASFVMALGGLVQGSIGFGLVVVAGPFLVMIDPRFIPGPALVAVTVLVGLMTARERGSVDLRGLSWAFAGRIPGTFGGAVAVAALPRDGLAIALAVIVLAAVVMSAGGWRLRPTPSTLFGAGTASGVMGTVGAIGGPPMALVYQERGGREVRATLSGFFLITVWLSIGSLAVVGRFGSQDVRLGLLIVPGMLVGYALSRRVSAALDGGYTRPAVLAVSAAAAVGVLIRYAL